MEELKRKGLSIAARRSNTLTHSAGDAIPRSRKYTAIPVHQRNQIQKIKLISRTRRSTGSRLKFEMADLEIGICRNRRRFWKGEQGEDKQAAYDTLAKPFR